MKETATDRLQQKLLLLIERTGYVILAAEKVRKIQSARKERHDVTEAGFGSALPSRDLPIWAQPLPTIQLDSTMPPHCSNSKAPLSSIPADAMVYLRNWVITQSLLVAVVATVQQHQ
jgi:hypothetical protein